MLSKYISVRSRSLSLSFGPEEGVGPGDGALPVVEAEPPASVGNQEISDIDGLVSQRILEPIEARG